MAEREFDVVLYGATGYTGRLIAQALDEMKANFAVAGRSPGKLEALSEGLKSQPETIVASVDDEGSLTRMAKRCKTLASAAGPFNRIGQPVMAAALSAGTHFVDTTGEQAYLRWAHQQDARAHEAGVTVVNATGFDVIPSDLAAALASRELAEPEHVDIVLSTNASLSHGTQRTMAASTGDWWEHKEGRFAAAVPGRYMDRFEVPGKAKPQTAVFIPWGDCVTAPRTTGAPNVRTWFLLPPDKAKRYHRYWPVQMVISRIPFVDRLFQALAPDPDGDGPDEDDRGESWFTILAEAEDASGEVRRAFVQGTDPYGLTAAATSRMALALARGEAPRAGVLTPTQAFDPERIQKMLPEYIEDARLLDP